MRTRASVSQQLAIIAVGTVLGLAAAIPAGAQTRYSAQPRDTVIKIKGSSTTHDWEMKGTLVGGYIEFGPGIKLDPAQTTLTGAAGDKVAAKVHAIIPVQSMHSEAEHMPDVMDHLMQTALKNDQFPRIEFTLTDMAFKGPHEAGKPFTFDTSGDLEIAGVTNKVSFPVTIEVVDDKKIKVNASVPLKMTDFKIDPPAPNIGLGLMKCADAVTIVLDWTLMERK